ncbi:gluconate 2-dehydrogenase subunit 3 family protein [Paenibacillus sp. GCM10023250]|uniref:gluconate 2-dehydrogenase subunit 3 family protein n=1 Tax=Paenibacillus sp. GCM10023250 TaxID=3252648 RepID=UPI00360CD83F
MTQKTHYPSFNVMDEEDAWDAHTQGIVNSRLSATPKHRALSRQEADTLAAICAQLLHDDKPAVLRFVLHHFDQTLHSSPGEGQRKAGVPEGKTLIRQGLQAVERCAKAAHASSFAQLGPDRQRKLLEEIGAGTAGPSEIWNGIPQQPFFQKLLALTVESYCSHPEVWSEIGYAGPAYPRGYVRTQLGQFDPWEAKAEQ